MKAIWCSLLAVVAVVAASAAVAHADVVLPAQAFLDQYCGGKPLTGEFEILDFTSGSFNGDCTIVFATKGELQTGKNGTITINGALSVTVQPGARGELEFQVDEGYTVSALSMNLQASEVQVKKFATLKTTAGDLVIAATKQVQVEEFATLVAEAGSIRITAGDEVELKANSSLTASTSISVSAPKCKVTPPVTVTAPVSSVC